MVGQRWIFIIASPSFICILKGTDMPLLAESLLRGEASRGYHAAPRFTSASSVFPALNTTHLSTTMIKGLMKQGISVTKFTAFLQLIDVSKLSAFDLGAVRPMASIYRFVCLICAGISSESVLFSVVEKWCNRECKRCQLELSDDNRKTILGDRLLFSVRYLLMTSEEFLSGPMRSGLFDQIETAIILGYILKHPVSDVSPRITPQVVNFLKRIRRRELYLPVPLSTRTKGKVTSDSKSLISNKLVLKKEKKKKKDDRDGESKCFTYTINVLASIFD